MSDIAAHKMTVQTYNQRRESRRFLAFNAFFAILRRDVRVTGREFLPFLLQALMQPLFFLFIFGKVLPGIGLAAGNFAALMLPGIVALTGMIASMQASLCRWYWISASRERLTIGSFRPCRSGG